MIETVSAQVTYEQDFFSLKEHKINYPQITGQMFDTIFNHYRPLDYAEGVFYKYQFMFKLHDTTIFDNLFLVEISNLCSHSCKRIYAIGKLSKKIIDSVDIKTFNKLIEHDSLNKFDQAISWMIFNNSEHRLNLFPIDSVIYYRKSLFFPIFKVNYRMGNVPDSIYNKRDTSSDTIYLMLINSQNYYIERYQFVFDGDDELRFVNRTDLKNFSPYRYTDTGEKISLKRKLFYFKEWIYFQYVKIFRRR